MCGKKNIYFLCFCFIRGEFWVEESSLYGRHSKLCKAVSLIGGKKKCNFEQKIVRFMKKIAPMRANQIARIIDDFKMDIKIILIAIIKEVVLMI